MPTARWQAFRKELAANPNDYDANFQLASILARRGQPDESRRFAGTRRAGAAGVGARRKAALAEGFHFEQAAGESSGVAARHSGAPDRDRSRSTVCSGRWCWCSAAIPARNCGIRPRS